MVDKELIEKSSSSLTFDPPQWEKSTGSLTIEEGGKSLPAVLVPREAATLLRVSQRTLQRMEKDGRLTPNWVGGQKRYVLVDLLRWLKGEE